MQKEKYASEGKRVSIQEEDIRTLTKLGCVPSQAKLYLSLLKIGEANGKTISNLSGMPRQEVYRILCELQEIGLVEKVIAIPSQFRAVPIQDGLSILLMQKAREYGEAEKETRKLIRKLGNNLEKTPRIEEEPELIVIPKKEALIKRLGNGLKNTRWSIDIVTTTQRFLQAMELFFEIYEKALERGVEVKVITEKVGNETLPENVQSLLPKPNFRLRCVVTRPPANLAIFDKREAFVAVIPAASLAESPAIWTNYPSFLAMYQDHFETMWGQAKEYELNGNNSFQKWK
jgi:sugar-specific transcriptional regulator TrmB